MYNYRKYTKDDSRDITVVSAKHPQVCNCGLCIAAQIYMKYQVKDHTALSEFDSHGRPIRSHRRKKRKPLADKNFDPNGPFFRILDKRSKELEKERQDFEQQNYLLCIRLLFDNDCQQPANCDDGILQTADGTATGPFRCQGDSQVPIVIVTQPSPCYKDIVPVVPVLAIGDIVPVLDIGDITAQPDGCCEETVTVNELTQADDENLQVVIVDVIDDAMYGILGVYCNRI